MAKRKRRIKRSKKKKKKIKRKSIKKNKLKSSNELIFKVSKKWAKSAYVDKN